jgi:hypothetical protein
MIYKVNKPRVSATIGVLHTQPFIQLKEALKHALSFHSSVFYQATLEDSQLLLCPFLQSISSESSSRRCLQKFVYVVYVLTDE